MFEDVSRKVSKVMSFVSKTRIFVSKTRNFAFKMMNFAAARAVSRRQPPGARSVLCRPDCRPAAGPREVAARAGAVQPARAGGAPLAAGEVRYRPELWLAAAGPAGSGCDVGVSRGSVRG